MDIDANNFRDKSLEQLTIGYDWELARNYAILSVRDRDGMISTFRLSGLTEYYINEDFGCMHISQCKLVEDGIGLYLSLDPYNEHEEKEEQDNFCFSFESIARIE